MADLETLTLQINTESGQATRAIGTLSKRLDALSASLAKLEIGKLNSLANGLNTLNMAIYSLNSSSSAWDYKRIAKNINEFATINVSQINGLSSSLVTLANSFTGMASAAAVSDNVTKMIQAINSLGYKSTAKALENIPKLEVQLSALIKTFAKLPNINQSIIDFVNGLANISNAGSGVAKATEGISKSIDKFGVTATHASRKAFSLSSAIGKIYSEYWMLIRAFSGLKKSFLDAADYLEAYNYFDVVAEKIGADTFRKAGIGTADEYADAFTSEMRRKLKQMSGLELDLEQRLIKTTNAKSLGLNITDITQYQASIASITNAMGQAQEVSTATAKAFSMLAADMGSLRNVDYEQVAQNLQSALTGQARALYKYGVDLTSATLEQYAYANGVDKAVSEMTQAEKAQLRLLAILDQSKVAWGDLANTINSPANQLRQLSNNFSELGTVLGQLFVPLMQNVLPWINGLSIALKQLAIDIATLLGIQLNIDEFGKGFSDTIDVDTEAVDDLNKSMKETKKNIREFDELKVIGGDKSKAGSGLADQIDLTKQIVAATSEYERVWDEAYRQMESKAQAIAEALKGALDPIRKIVEDFHIGDFFKAGEDISSLAISIFDFFSDALEDVDWKGIGVKIGQFFDGIKWNELFGSVGSLLGNALQGVFDLWTGSFSVAPFETAIITAFALLKFTGLGDVISTTVTDTVRDALKSKGLSDKVAGKLGISAISVGLGVALTIDNIKSVSNGEYNVGELQFWIKSAISSLFTGAGVSLAATSIGIAGGALTFGVAAGVTLLANVIVGYAAMETSYESVQKIYDAEYAWIDEHNLDAMNILTKISLRAELDNQSFENLDELTDKVLELSKNYETLTDTQKGELKRYSDELVSAVPGIVDQIDEITGAWKGTDQALKDIIEREKEYLKLESTKQNYKDAEAAKQQAEKDVALLEEEQTDLLKKEEYLRKLFVSEYGETKGNWAFEGISKDVRDGWDTTNAFINYLGFDYLTFGNQLLDKNNSSSTLINMMTLFLGKQDKVNAELSDTQKVLQDVTKEYNYWDQQLTDAYTKQQQEAEQFADDNKQTLEDIKQNIVRSKIPKTVETTMNTIDKKIVDGDRVSTNDMENMFTHINNSFNGLGDGKVPAEVQTTMDNIKKAILDNSPTLCNYMQLLKIQMEQAFADAHYTGNDLIWNRNNISARLGVDVGKIEENLQYTAKPVLGSLEDDLKELFGGTLPEEVDKKLKTLAKTIKDGAGKKAVTDALNDLRYTFLQVAADSGMYIDLGLGYSIDQYGRFVYAAIGNVLDNTEETTLEKIEAQSPSKLYRRIGKYIPEGLALGITDEIPYAVKSISDLAANIQSVFTGFTYNIPNLGLNNSYGASYYNNGNPYADAGSSLYDAMSSMYRNQNGQTEVVFRVEGDPYGIFKVVREENDKYRNRTHRSAFN